MFDCRIDDFKDIMLIYNFIGIYNGDALAKHLGYR